MVLPDPENPGTRHKGTIFSGHIAGDASAIGAKWVARESRRILERTCEVRTGPDVWGNGGEGEVEAEIGSPGL